MYDTTPQPITSTQNEEARLLASKLSDSVKRKRAYVDFTGALYAIDCLSKAGLRVTSQRSIFRCTKLYTDFEVTDIYCNSHMLYVATVYGTEYVKIPYPHKKYGILPEAYVVVEVKIGMKEAELKGVLTPKDLDIAPNDGKYYNIPLTRLKPMDTLSEIVKKYAGIKSSIGRHLDCMNLFVPYMDNKLNENDKKKLIEHILTCETCKKRLIETIEFDNQSKGIENLELVLSKEDLSTKDKFVKKLNDNKTSETKLKGVIDVIYEDNEKFAELKENALDFKTPSAPPKAKKLILLTFAVVTTLLIMVVFAFNIPVNKSEDLNKEVEGSLYEGLEELPDEQDLSEPSNYDIVVPKVKNKGFATVSKVSWEVTSGVKDDEQKKFLQTAGKSIRLNLQNDLLLSSEVAVNDRVKFDIRFLRDGNIDEINVAESSGTPAVDEVIKQSVTNTMQYMRPPKGAFQGRKSGLTLVINF